MKEEILNYLCCPVCGSDFELETLKKCNGEVEKGNLTCKKCYKKYPIIDWIPRILPEELCKSEKKTIDSFAFEWKYYGRLLSNNLNTEFLTRVQPWREEDFKGKVVLDVGCGAGRLSRLASDYGAKVVFSIDLGRAVEAARELSVDYTNIHFFQGSLFELPFKQKFDIVFCMGVLHHTPSPSLGFKSILKPLKDGGKIGIWVYSREGNEVINPLMNIFRVITTKLNSQTKLILANLIVRTEEFFYSLINNIAGNIYYGDYLKYFNTQISSSDRQSIVFDFMSTDIVKYISRKELESWLTGANLTDIVISKHNTEGSDTKGWALTGKKFLNSNSANF